MERLLEIKSGNTSKFDPAYKVLDSLIKLSLAYLFTTLVVKLSDIESTEAYFLATKKIDILISVLFLINFIVGVCRFTKSGYLKNPLNYFDLIASIPTLTGFSDTIELRLIRLLTASKSVDWKNYYGLVRYGNSVTKKISHVFIFFITLKLIIYSFEEKSLWVPAEGINTLFAILGFSLGIVLSKQIGAAYGKHSKVNEILLRMRGKLLYLSAVMGESSKENRKQIIHWASNFLELFESETPNNKKFEESNSRIYQTIRKIESTPGVLTQEFSRISSDAAFCLGLARGRIPSAYANLTHQAIFLYLIMLTIFIPGITGIVTITLAVHLLYGLYFISHDFDSIIGGDEYNLISVKTDPLIDFVNENR